MKSMSENLRIELKQQEREPDTVLSKLTTSCWATSIAVVGCALSSLFVPSKETLRLGGGGARL